jgi:hypothetical protein
MGARAKIKEELGAWPNISMHPHRFAAVEFRFNKAEVGHIHIDGTVDIPFTRAIRDALLEERLAEEHRWVPNSGWTTFRIRSDHEIKHALWLLRLSYLRYALKADSDPHRYFRQEADRLNLNPTLESLLAQFVPASSGSPANTQAA